MVTAVCAVLMKEARFCDMRLQERKRLQRCVDLCLCVCAHVLEGVSMEQSNLKLQTKMLKLLSPSVSFISVQRSKGRGKKNPGVDLPACMMGKILIKPILSGKDCK